MVWCGVDVTTDTKMMSSHPSICLIQHTDCPRRQRGEVHWMMMPAGNNIMTLLVLYMVMRCLHVCVR